MRPGINDKVLNKNNDILHRFTYHAHIQEEWNKEVNKEECKILIKMTHPILEPPDKVEDQQDLGAKDLHQCGPYENDC